MSNTDKKGLVEDLNPLERNHLRYLLMYDPEILELVRKDKDTQIFMHPFLYAFGLF